MQRLLDSCRPLAETAWSRRVPARRTAHCLERHLRGTRSGCRVPPPSLSSNPPRHRLSSPFQAAGRWAPSPVALRGCATAAGVPGAPGAGADTSARRPAGATPPHVLAPRQPRAFDRVHPVDDLRQSPLLDPRTWSHPAHELLTPAMMRALRARTAARVSLRWSPRYRLGTRPPRSSRLVLLARRSDLVHRRERYQFGRHTRYSPP